MIKNVEYDFKYNHKNKYKLGNVLDSAIPMEIASIIEKYPGLVILIASNTQNILSLKQSIQKFTNFEVMHLPDWESFLFDKYLLPHDAIALRLSVLYKLYNLNRGLLILSIPSLLQKICSSNNLITECFLIKKNDYINKRKLFYKFKKLGYNCVHKILKPGEFFYSSSFIDVYPMGGLSPCRIYLKKNDCIVLELKKINVYNQNILEEIKFVFLLPKYEFPIYQDRIDLFKKNWQLYFNIPLSINNNCQKKYIKFISNIKYWQPFFFTHKLVTLFDYFSENTLIIQQNTFQIELQDLSKKILHQYHISTQEKNNFLKLEKMWIDSSKTLFFLKKFCSIKIEKEKILENKNSINLLYRKLPDLFHTLNIQKKINYLSSFLHSFSGTIVFSFFNEDRLKKFLFFFNDIKISLKYIKKIVNIDTQKKYLYTISNLSNGFMDVKNNFLLICEKNLLPIINYKKNSFNITKNIQTSIFNLHINHPIIHFEHGIGRYKGLKTIETAKIKSEYLVIAYAEEDKLYVPITYLYLVSPYISLGKETAPLHKLGSSGWNKEKKKIGHVLYDHAAKLLDLYAQRASKRGFSFHKYEEKYKIFCNDFPFNITKDQKKVIKSIINDMNKSTPMDHLLCGDVGFGKTEVAMRAAFLSFSNNKQVAVLVPTTLLAQQHYENFIKRFSNWSTVIKILSRFETEKEQSKIVKDTQMGLVNILIGTHKLLFKNIKWYDLGLLIIDEEHRFGVQHKENIQQSYPNIDILTLTATPIPRTLNMAMTGIKNLSIISSPPDKRLSVKTFLQEYNPLLVRKIILREISRKGQVYYIFNKVKKINNIAIRLCKLVPEANIQIGHGKMHNHDLKKVIKDFYQKKFNVLVCTTIIESGIDIPNANTIIIENADHFGLSQLHQLRGRVGRSNNQAYAFLLVNSFKYITTDAKKRLESMLSIDNFGAGFSLASQDLEIRGVGELLGKEQSGHIHNIGFSLYIKLLKNAIQTIKEGKKLSLNELINKQPEVELYLPSFLPDNYISDVNQRLNFYKKISNAKKIDEIKTINLELFNQFGTIPQFAKNLMLIAEIRILSQKIGIYRIQANKNGGYIEFNIKNMINIEYLLKMFDKEPGIWKMESNTKLKFTCHLCDTLRINWILSLLYKFKKNISVNK